MSLEHSPARSDGAGAGTKETVADLPPPPDAVVNYWHALIDEKAAGEFLDLTARSMQKFRWQGGGPRYVVISSRCLRYRRVKSDSGHRFSSHSVNEPDHLSGVKESPGGEIDYGEIAE